MTDPAKIGRSLRSFATHHNHGEGWTYTRNLHGIKHIRYDRDWKGYHSPWNRVIRAFGSEFWHTKGSIGRNMGFKWSFRSAWAWVQVCLTPDNNRPDGTLNDGIVMTVWEEDGEYIEFVGPTVGVKIADFLENDPENPYAVAIAAEISRVRRLGVKRRKAEKEQSDG